MTQNHEKHNFKAAQKMTFFSHFVRAKALPESSSCVGMVTISRKGPKNADEFTVNFQARFLLKNQVFET